MDFWLSRGYYRMQQDFFTCRFVYFDNTYYAVQWLRIVLPDVTYGKSQLRLFRINAKFAVTVTPFVLTEEIESLYVRYRAAIDFDAPETVESCLLGGAAYNDFDTKVIEVRDEGRLIAAGIFDNGTRSIAGIMNFYDPAYRKHSLGKFLMLQKLNHARAAQKAYYYPGYLVHNYPKFDYKLFPCEAATEVFDSVRGVWLPFSWEMVNALSAGRMEESDGDYLGN